MEPQHDGVTGPLAAVLIRYDFPILANKTLIDQECLSPGEARKVATLVRAVPARVWIKAAADADHLVVDVRMHGGPRDAPRLWRPATSCVTRHTRCSKLANPGAHST